jgi:hypothetical protein
LFYGLEISIFHVKAELRRRLDAKVGLIFPKGEGRFAISMYVLHRDDRPDTYANRKWYVRECEGDLLELARTHFGAGALRPTQDHFGKAYWEVVRRKAA